MSYLTGKHMHRRTFLRGVGVTAALPLLDAMVPAGWGLQAKLAAATPARTRLVCIEEVHGQAGCNALGASKFLFAPETTGRDFTLITDNPWSTVDAYREHRYRHCMRARNPVRV